MWIKNKETGLKWLVTDKELLERLSIDSNFEVVEEEKPKSKKDKQPESKEV